MLSGQGAFFELPALVQVFFQLIGTGCLFELTTLGTRFLMYFANFAHHIISRISSQFSSLTANSLKIS